MKQKWLRTITALAALIFVTLAIAENIYLDIGLSGVKSLGNLTPFARVFASN
jgi:hypothetical protein